MTIVQNKKAHHDYSIEERYEAGIALEGWEVKSIRANQVQLNEAYVIVRNGELYLLNSHISPLPTTSTHVKAEPARTRKLLLHASEIRKLIGKVERAGYSLVPLNMHYSKGRVKLEVGLGKGKRQFEKSRRSRSRLEEGTESATEAAQPVGFSARLTSRSEVRRPQVAGRSRAKPAASSSEPRRRRGSRNTPQQLHLSVAMLAVELACREVGLPRFDPNRRDPATLAVTSSQSSSAEATPRRRRDE